MVSIFNYSQIKKSKQTNSRYSIYVELFQFEHLLHLVSESSFVYNRRDGEVKLNIHHGITINLKNGDLTVYHQVSNFSDSNKIISRTQNIKKKNCFNKIQNLIENGLYNGERKKNFWGSKYPKNVDKLFQILFEKINPFFIGTHCENKDYRSSYLVNPLFDMLVDFHLVKKKIKFHDSVYHTITTSYPKSKWLKSNGNKFLSAVLDSHGIKSKYVISIINQKKREKINIRSLSYLCHLFGDSYNEYLKMFNWVKVSSINLPIRVKKHTLKNKQEKINLVKLMNTQSKSSIVDDNLLLEVYRILSIREFLENKGAELKFSASSLNDFNLLYSKWSILKSNFKRGYSIQYVFPSDFIKYIETDILIDFKVFNVKVLKSEEDFLIEGILMKNCMGKQFNKGEVFIYISMIHGKGRVNLEYKNGILITAYGKANSDVDDKFKQPIKDLSERMKMYSFVVWSKEKNKHIITSQSFE
jgi:hypothetical protein